MATFPIKSGITGLVNVDLTNTIDFHIATTNHVKALNYYIDELATYYTYNYTKHTGDPVTSQVNFFLALNEGELRLSSDERGTYNSKVYSRPGTSYKLSKLDTYLKPNEVWIRADDGLPERKTTSEFTTASSFHAFNLITEEDTWYTVPEDIDTDVEFYLGNIQDYYGASMMGLEFLQYWYEKFQTTHSKIKEDYIAALSGKALSENIFDELGDTVGSIARVVESVDPLSVSMILDTNFEATDTPVSTLPPNIDDKLDSEVRLFNGEITERVNVSFRKNMRRVIETLGAQDLSHNSILMPDYMHLRRVSSMSQKLNGIVAQTLGDTYELLFYIRNLQNKQKAHSPVFETIIEDKLVRVDMLKNRIQNINKVIGNDILKSRPINSPDLS